MKLRHKLLLFGLAVAALTALAVFVAGGAIIRASVSDRVREELDKQLLLLADRLAEEPDLLPGPPAGTCTACDDFADRTARLLGVRVTLIAPDDRVLGDSELDLGRVGSGAPVPTALLHLGQRVERDGLLVGFVHLTVPLSEVQRATGGYNATLAAVSFLILLGVAVVGYVAAKRFSRPIEAMSRTADAIAAGRRDLEVEYTSGDEIGRLGSSLNRMTRTLAEQIRTISSDKRLRDAIFAGMQEGILVLDMDHRVLLCNDALRAILGLRGQDAMGRPLIEIARDRAVIEGFDAALMRGEERREIVRVGAGVERAFEINVAPLTDAAGVQLGAIGLFFDVTRLIALENVRREFVADASHELRTPLTSIKAFVETLLGGGLEDPENNRRFLEIIKKHADRMEGLLDDLTDLSSIETESVPLEIERMDLAPLVQELFESLRPKATTCGVTLVSAVPAGTLLAADRRRVEQVLLNLLDNAIKFNRPGGTVTLRVVSETSAAGAPRLRVEIEDTGIGIPTHALDKVFHRFYRVDQARSRQVGGTGLGLAIVKHLMRLQGGSVGVESDPGRGSRFILEFPAAPLL